jgi:HEAT repeat protein
MPQAHPNRLAPTSGPTIGGTRVDSISAEAASLASLSIAALHREFESPRPRTRLAVLRAASRGQITDPSTLELFIRALSDSDRRLRLQGAALLGQVGPAAEVALPALIDLFRVPDRRVLDLAYSAVRNIGATALPILREALHHEDRGVRIGALRSFGRLGSTAEVVIPDLLEIVRGRSDLRADAIATLSLIGPKAAIAIPDLLSALDDPDDQVRRWATEALWKIGAPAIEPLRNALADPCLAVHVRAAFALAKLEPSNPALFPALADGLSATDKWLRRHSAELLGTLAPPTADLIARLQQTRVDDIDGLVRKSAKDALRALRKRLELTQLQNDHPSSLRPESHPKETA